MLSYRLYFSQWMAWSWKKLRVWHHLNYHFGDVQCKLFGYSLSAGIGKAINLFLLVTNNYLLTVEGIWSLRNAWIAWQIRKAGNDSLHFCTCNCWRKCNGVRLSSLCPVSYWRYGCNHEFKCCVDFVDRNEFDILQTINGYKINCKVQSTLIKLIWQHMYFWKNIFIGWICLPSH